MKLIVILVYLQYSFGQPVKKLDPGEFYKAVKLGKVENVRRDLESDPSFDINQFDDNGFAAIHHAVDSGSALMVKLLAEKGADINAKTDNYYGYTALHRAILENRTEIRNELLEQNCAIDIMNDDNLYIPLFHAIELDDKDSAAALLEKKTNSCRFVDDRGRYPIHLAVLHSEETTDILKMILNDEYGKLTVNNPDGERERTSLHYAGRFPSNNSEEVIRLLMESNADNEMEDTTGYTPEELAYAVGYPGSAQLIRFFWTNKADKIGKLEDLCEKADASSSFIQNYADYVLSLPSYSDIIDQTIAEKGKKLNWTADFGDLDKHLIKAKGTAKYWNTDVYVTMKGLYGHLDLFSQQYIQSYLKLEPKLRAMNRTELDQEIVDENLKWKRLFYEEEGYSSRMIRFMMRREEEKIKKDMLDYGVGLKDIAKLFNYISSYALEYEHISNETVSKLENFRAELTVDRSNFENDFKWLSETSTVSAKIMNESLNEIRLKQAELGISSKRVDEIQAELDNTINRIQTWNAVSVAISATQGILNAGELISSEGKKRSEKYKNKNLGKQKGIDKYAKDKKLKYQKKAVKYHNKKWMGKVNKYENKMKKFFGASKKNIIASKLGQKAKSAGKWMKNFGKAGKFFGAANVAMSFASMGFSIASMVELNKEQNKMNEAKEEFNKEMENYGTLTKELWELKDSLQTVSMTTESKVEARLRIELLLEKIGNAITEAEMIRNTWTDIKNEIEKMGSTANVAIGYMDKEKQKAAFENLFDFLKTSTDRWRELNNLSTIISDTFNGE